MSEEVVRRVRDALFPDRIGKPLNQPGEAETPAAKEKAFLIVAHTAFQLNKGGGAGRYGLIRAQPGSNNNHNGYNCDVVALRTGEHWDALINKFGNAFPSWQHHDADPEIAARWVATPITNDLFVKGEEAPSHVEGPGQGGGTSQQQATQIDVSVLQDIRGELQRLRTSIAALTDQIAALRAEGIKVKP
jgi:hypothetical protein